MRAFVPAAAAALTLAFSSLAAEPVQAQDATGTWEIAYSMETPRGSQERSMTVHLTQDGEALTGTAEMAMMARPGGGGGGGGGRGGGGGQVRETEISNGKVVGTEVTFTVEFGAGQRTFSMTFTGLMDGDAMTGTVSNPMGGDSPFTATRKEG